MSNDPFSQNPNALGHSNPYAPTSQTGTSAEVDPNDLEAFRNAHLSHEASVKSIGCLYYLGAASGVFLGLIYLVGAIVGGFGDEELPVAILIGLGIFMLGMGLAQGCVGYGLRRLLPWARVGGIVLSAIGLLGIPIGTIISAYFLYLLVCHKGEVVFSDYYRHVVDQTPHIQYKTSIIVKIFVGLLIGVFALIIIAAIAGAFVG